MIAETSGGFILKPGERILLQEEFAHMWVNSPDVDWHDGRIVLSTERLFIQSYWAQRENETRSRRGEWNLLVDMDIIPLSAIGNVKKEIIKIGLRGRECTVLRVDWRKQARWFEVKDPDMWVSVVERHRSSVEPAIAEKRRSCKKCGAELVEGAKFCGRCGSPV